MLPLRSLLSAIAFLPLSCATPAQSPTAATRAFSATPLPTASAAPASATSAAAAPEYRSVHIDTLAPDKVAQFESARIEWLAALTKAHANDGRGMFLKVGDHRYFTVRSFATFSDFDTRGDAIDRSLAAVPKEAGDRYDQGADSSLVFPHTSEIWSVNSGLSYAPASGALTERTAAYGSFVLEDVMPEPTAADRYHSATLEINRALAEARYPLTRACFHTMYGAGHVITMWLAHSKEELDGAPSVQDAVAKVRGAERAAELFAACEASVVHREVEPLTVRHDLSQ